MTPTTVYLLLKHPPEPYGSRGSHMDASIVVGAYTNAKEPQSIASEKNARKGTYYFYTVKRVKVKP